MANPYSIEPANPLQALMMGVQGYDQGKKIATESRRQDALAQLMGQPGQAGATPNYAGVANKLAAAGDLAGATQIAGLNKALAGPEQTDEIKEYNLYKQQGGKLDFFGFKTELKKAGATKVNTNVNTGEKEYDKVLSKAEGERFTGYQKDAQSAAGQKTTLDIMEKATKDPNFYSGIGAEKFALPLKQAVAAYGGDPNAAAPMETFRALSSRSIIDAAGGSLGAGFSNADRDFIMGTVPNLQNTKEGNQQLIDVGRAVAQRKQEIAKLAREYAASNKGRIDANFDNVLQEYAAKNPLFKGAATAGAPQAPAAPRMRWTPDGGLQPR